MPESPRSLSSSSAERGAVWFYAHNKQKLGPFCWEEFRNLAATGQLKSEDMVFQQGTQRWQPASAVPDLFPPPPPPPTCLTKFLGQTMAAGHAAQIALGLARALHALHQKNILHNKLTPEHILLTAEGEPKLTGFDAARSLTVETDLSLLESAVGALAYMAPEQARSEKLGPSADIYALGAILYELLTGRPPFQGDTALETVKRVLDQPAAPPSHFNATVPRDLDAICLRCLRKESHQRYASALDLAEDLRRFLAHEPILAQPERSLVEPKRATKRRRPSMLLVLGLLAWAGIGIFLYFNRHDLSFAWLRPTEKPIEQTKPERKAEVKPEPPPPPKPEPRFLRDRQLTRVAVVWKDNPAQALELLRDPVACPMNLRDAAWHSYEQLCRFDRAELTRSHGEVTALAATTDGGADEDTAPLLASGGSDRVIRLWDVTTGQLQRTLKGHTAPISALALQPDGKILLSGDRDGQLKLWDLARGEERKEHFHTSLLESKDAPGKSILAVAMTPDGRTAAAAVVQHAAKDSVEIQGGNVELWDAQKGTIRSILRGVYGPLAFSPDGKTLAVSGHLWDAATGTPRGVQRVPNGPVRSVAFSADGTIFALGIDAGRREGRTIIDAQLWPTRETSTTRREGKSSAPHE